MLLHVRGITVQLWMWTRKLKCVLYLDVQLYQDVWVFTLLFISSAICTCMLSFENKYSRTLLPCPNLVGHHTMCWNIYFLHISYAIIWQLDFAEHLLEEVAYCDFDRQKDKHSYLHSKLWNLNYSVIMNDK